MERIDEEWHEMTDESYKKLQICIEDNNLLLAFKIKQPTKESKFRFVSGYTIVGDYDHIYMSFAHYRKGTDHDFVIEQLGDSAAFYTLDELGIEVLRWRYIATPIECCHNNDAIQAGGYNK